MKNYFHGIDLDLDDNLYIYQLHAEKQSIKYNLYEVYKIHKSAALIVNQLGSWYKGITYLDFVMNENKNVRRHNLRVSYHQLKCPSASGSVAQDIPSQGVNFKVTSLHYMPYIGLSKEKNGEIKLANGMFVDIFKELAMVMNFTYTVIEPPDGEWGVLRDDGTWSGMVGQLEAKVVDFGLL